MSDRRSTFRRLGEGYEPHVDEDSGALTYSLPVDSGFVSVDFSFGIRHVDLDVLLNDPHRRATLEVVAHTVLQRSMGLGGTKLTQAAFDDLVFSVLHSSPVELDQYIDRIDQDCHIVTRHYVDQILIKRSKVNSNHP